MALKKQPEVEELADRLTESADATHDRLKQALQDQEISVEDARVVFQQETTLRQQANSLYIDAAKCVVDDLAMPQKEFMAVINKANKRIAKIQKIAAFLDLVADILSLATAAYAAKPKPILAALNEVNQDLDNLKTKASTNA